MMDGPAAPGPGQPLWRLLLRAIGLVGGMAGAEAVLLAVLPHQRLVAWLRESGLAGALLGGLLLALAGLVATAMLFWARATGNARRAARRPQGIVVPLLAALALAALWWLRPVGGEALVPAGRYVIGGGALLLAFPLLLAERTLAGMRSERLPEAPWLAALLFLPLAALAIHAALAAAGLGAPWDLGIARLVALLLGLVGLELLGRGLVRWFLPLPAAATATAAANSLCARLLYPAGWAAISLAAPLRENFGIEVSRSWALAYLRAAAVPMALLTLLFCWGLTGVRLVELDRRAVYERLGIPVAVLQPGLHLILPWPMGILRGADYGEVHALPLGPGAVAPAGTAAAEDPAPPEADRLWDQTHQNELAVLIASDSGGGQSFQTVSLDIRVLYRIGMDDASVLHAVYATADPQALVRSAAGRLLAQDFAARTLNGALGESREALADQLRSALQAALDSRASGVEILAVVIEGIHPPAGAADAYHRVQAAEILANASVNNERGRAEATASYAQQEARDRIARAQSAAAERVSAAQAEATQFGADRLAAQAGGQAFLLERYFADLGGALSRAPLVILDHRLDTPDAPVIDLRPLSAAASRGPLDED